MTVRPTLYTSTSLMLGKVFGSSLETIRRFQQRKHSTLNRLRVKLNFASQEVLKWVWPSTNRNRFNLHSLFKHYLREHNASGKKVLTLYAKATDGTSWAANSQTKSPIELKDACLLSSKYSLHVLTVYYSSFYASFGIVHSSVKFLYDLQNRRLIHTKQISSSGCAIDFSVRTAESSEAKKSGTPRRASPVKSSKRREIRVPSTPLGRVLGWATSLSFVQCVEVLVSLFVPRGGGLFIGNLNDVCGSLWN